jgi:hypothetical protein
MPGAPPGVPGLLEGGSVQVEGAWEGYQPYRIERARQELYPHR